eukprot:893758-Pleurochrysis_carterae.AAC.1
MATNPVTRQLAFNAMSLQLGARRPIMPDGEVALHYTSTSLSSLSACTRPTRLWMIMFGLDATLEDNWGVDMWPA